MLGAIDIYFERTRKRMARNLYFTGSDDEAADSRLIVWRAGMDMVKTHPLFGVGVGNFKPLIESYEQGGALVRPHPLPPLYGDPISLPD